MAHHGAAVTTRKGKRDARAQRRSAIRVVQALFS
jgi:hypothetical protein